MAGPMHGGSLPVVMATIEREGIDSVRDLGPLPSPRAHTSLLAADAYLGIEVSVGARPNSVCLHHALSDGNKRPAAVLAQASWELRDIDESAPRLKVVSADLWRPQLLGEFARLRPMHLRHRLGRLLAAISLGLVGALRA